MVLLDLRLLHDEPRRHRVSSVWERLPMTEFEIMVATLTEHGTLFGRCCCGRVPLRSQAEHVADELELALRESGYGIFAFENLDAIAAGEFEVET